VGMSKHPKRRVISHVRGTSVTPHWVKTYPPVGIESVIAFDSRNEAMDCEREKTLALARTHGSANVRGAEWTDMDARPPTQLSRERSD
jgi:predicted GIY-YIG superfamily endonuclease